MTNHLLVKLFSDALSNCTPEKLITHSLSWQNNILRIKDRFFDLSDKHIHITGSGKCAAGMGKGAVNVFGDQIKSSYLVSNTLSHVFSLTLDRGNHPVPKERSLQCGNKMKHFIESLKENDFFIYMLSGGSSSLIEIPEPPLTLHDIQTTTDILLKRGLNIKEINSFRMLMSSLKGGRLIDNLNATGIVLVISDIMGDPLPFIGSGPLLITERNPEYCVQLINSYHLENILPDHVMKFISHYKKNDTTHVLDIPHFVIGNNRTFLNQVKSLAESRGIQSIILNQPLSGNVSSMAEQLTAHIHSKNHSPLLYILGGETTVHVKGSGKGGRNQELALRLLPELEHHPNISILCAGTDGIDGPTDAAGALITQHTAKTAEKLKLNRDEYLENNDSYNFLKQTNSLIKTGPTGNNLLDITMILFGNCDLTNRNY